MSDTIFVWYFVDPQPMLESRNLFLCKSYTKMVCLCFSMFIVCICKDGMLMVCLCFTPVSIESSQFSSLWMAFNHLRTNSTKFAHYRLKIRKVTEFFDFQSLMQHPLYESTLKKINNSIN